MAQSFVARPDLFEDVYAPGTSRFFDDYGVLYLSVDELREVVSEIRQVEKSAAAMKTACLII